MNIFLLCPAEKILPHVYESDLLNIVEKKDFFFLKANAFLV